MRAVPPWPPPRASFGSEEEFGATRWSLEDDVDGADDESGAVKDVSAALKSADRALARKVSVRGEDLK